jgi:hypothetical protein
MKWLGADSERAAKEGLVAAEKAYRPAHFGPALVFDTKTAYFCVNSYGQTPRFR